MKCPYCGDEESKVIDSRPTEDGERIRRRRECLRCRMRFTTYEVVETVPLIVIKKDNSREPFDRQKLLNAMLRACAKRPVSYDALERAVSSIEQSLMSSYDREVYKAEPVPTVFVHQRKGRRSHLVAKSHANRNSPCNSSLSCTKTTAVSDKIAAFQPSTYLLTQSDSFRRR